LLRPWRVLVSIVLVGYSGGLTLTDDREAEVKSSRIRPHTSALQSEYGSMRKG
jgi:hypothetical protein